MPYSLPRRRHAAPVFHFNESSDESEDERPSLPQLKLRSRPTSFHGAPTVPFAPPVQRTNSSPILLSNGKPLKSSMKASSSSAEMPAPPARARAASTPSLDGHVAKNVHFPSSDLATVRFYSRSARPASLSLADPADTETETETERAAVHELDAAQSSPVPAASPAADANVHLESLCLYSASPAQLALTGTLLVRNLAYQKTVAVRFTLDNWDTTSEVLAHHTASLPALPRALYAPGSGLHRPPPEPLPACARPAWDRFAFSIRLDDYVPTLAVRTLWLVARYSTPSSPDADETEQPVYEWWDNNGGSNYRVVFRLKQDDQLTPPRFPTPPPPIALRVPSSPSPARLRSLSLSNYAAPTSPTGPAPQLPPARSPTLSASSISDGSPSSLATPVDLVGMEIVNGFPATGPSGLGFGVGGDVGLALDLGQKDDEEEDKGRSEVALYWPWARPRPHPHHAHAHAHDHEDAHEHAVRVHTPPPLCSPAPAHTLKVLPTRKRTPHREPSPPLSDSSSSSSSSSSSGSSTDSRRRPRVGRRVFPAVAASENGSKIPSAPVQRDSAQDKDKNDEDDKEKMEKDKVYQALVRKWCFAGPVRAQNQHSHSPSPSRPHPHPHAQHGHGMGMGVVR